MLLHCVDMPCATTAARTTAVEPVSAPSPDLPHVSSPESKGDPG